MEQTLAGEREGQGTRLKVLVDMEAAFSLMMLVFIIWEENDVHPLHPSV